MKALSKAVAHIAMEVHPERIDAICSALGESQSANVYGVVKNGLGEAFFPRLMQALDAALRATPHVTAGELSAMFRASSATALLMAGASSVELVWTGPGTGMVPIRHTSQVLTGLIDEAHEQLYLVSFVAYHVGNVISALQRAIERGVQVRVLVERSKEHGGSVTVDSVAMLRKNLPAVQFFEWEKGSGDTAQGASVHAKCAVADGNIAFVTSANLSDAAMERNMELGVLLRGGQVPRLLDQHLTALVTTKQIRPL
jgi:phosphatidylserine/phosphatidylglycerophosphate/cardiolipin synthase-like enzyme